MFFVSPEKGRRGFARFVRAMFQRWRYRRVAYSLSGKRLFLWCLPKRWKPNTERVPFPLFEIACNPTIKLSDIKARRFNIVEPPLGCVVVTDEEWICSVPEETITV